MAHAMKKPVVATRVDGRADVIRDDENGFLVPPRNPETMAEKVIYLLPHTGAAHQMADRGSQELGKYDYCLMVSRLEELCYQLIERSDLRLLIAKRGTPRPGLGRDCFGFRGRDTG